MRMSRGFAGRGLVICVVVLMAAFVGVVVASPWLTRSFVRRSEDGHELSEMGQAYGGVSAILSGLAFCGIAISLLLQWRQVRLTRIMAARERHFELVKLGIDDPSLMLAPLPGGSPASARKRVICNLWVAHWAMGWDIGSLSPARLRVLFDELFGDETARAWWAAGGSPAWARDRGGVFWAVADEAYRDACARRMAVPEPVSA